MKYISSTLLDAAFNIFCLFDLWINPAGLLFHLGVLFCFPARLKLKTLHYTHLLHKFFLSKSFFFQSYKKTGDIYATKYTSIYISVGILALTLESPKVSMKLWTEALDWRNTLSAGEFDLIIQNLELILTGFPNLHKTFFFYFKINKFE